ncbi:UV-stimulated scaffold protein A [Hypomesus transpacificus]|uniref:UV-stimulated scaffold protein A n=1 Tax=Hypomesus transpacificus TaxID=137520 RepID=UPI001F07CD8E|nr:UV-stimulated scaffold protein A [Hypomesus transpacificus]
MDYALRDQLSGLVEELTTSGEPQLNQDKMKELKKLCKASNDYIEHVYNLLMSQLAQEHAEIRLSAFHMAAELFSRSHHFRLLLVSDFQDFLDLTVETDSDQPLPPPKEVARKLKTLAIQTIQAWHASYGEAYKKLALGYHFLKQVKKVDFNDVQARTLAERKREEEKQRRLDRIYKEKVEKATMDMEESCEEIQECLTEMDTCMKLLLPSEFDLSVWEAPVNPNTEPASETPVSTNLSSESSKPANEMTESTNEKRCSVKGTHDGTEVSSIDLDEQPCCSKDLHEERDEKESSDEESEMDEVVDEDAFIRNTGLLSHKYSLDLNLSTDLRLKETEENEAVVTTVKDLHKLISSKHLPAVKSWVQVFTRAGGQDQLLRQALDLKKALETAIRKHQDLHIDYCTRHRKVMRASDDEDEDFEEVPEKEGFEPHIPEHLREEYGLEPSTSSSSSKKPASSRPQPRAPPQDAQPLPRSKRRALEEEQDPTCAAATLSLLRQRLPQACVSAGPEQQTAGSSNDAVPGSSQGQADVPVVPFGLDLYYWGQEQPTAGKIIKYSSQHQFWVPNEVEEEVENPELSAQMKSRYITFAGRFTPVTHSCRAPLSNGARCERQDRVKCPFHGVIVPRDDLGRPTYPEDAARLEREERKRREEQPEWRDPELMRDIEAATGEDLGSSRMYGKGRGKGKGKKKKKYPNLSDLKQSANTSRSRLEKKVFNKSSMRRVTEVMNKMDKRKHEKFSNQFNYAIN